MGYASYNPNPRGKSVGDCVVRAIAKAFGMDWDDAYLTLAATGLERKDLPNADDVWGACLRRHGFKKRLIDEEDDYTVADFANDHPKGTYILRIPEKHVVTVCDGAYYDSWDSGAEAPAYYYERSDN